MYSEAQIMAYVWGIVTGILLESLVVGAFLAGAASMHHLNDGKS
jgi:hypothetical protein